MMIHDVSKRDGGARCVGRWFATLIALLALAVLPGSPAQAKSTKAGHKMNIQEVTSPPPQMIRVWGKCFFIYPIMAKALRA